MPVVMQPRVKGFPATFLLPAMLGLSLALSACVSETGGTGGAPAPVAGKIDDTVYQAQKDGTIVLPAVPVEKVPDEFQRQSVRYDTDQPAGTIIINPIAKHLYLVTGKNKAIRYGISVGRAGFEWSGEAVVSERKAYPTWYPPAEMIERKPELAKWEKGQPGGPQNPLGARALYLTTGGRDYGYRIHGTPEWFSIGKNASSGCIRMIHQDVIDLFNRVPVGAKVIVLTRDGKLPTRLSLPPPQPVAAKKTTPKPATPVVVPAGAVPTLKVLPPPVFATPTAAPATTAPVAVKPAATTPVCAVPLVNGLCPPATNP